MSQEAPEKAYRAVPERMPPPSFAPLFSALGIALLFWSFLTGTAIMLLGLGFLITGGTIWIQELTDEPPVE